MATAPFLAKWLSHQRGDVATLIKVVLSDPSALTLYLADREVTAPGSPPQTWEAALDDVGPVVHNGTLGAMDPVLATFDFHLAPRQLAVQSAGQQIPDLFASYYWHGAAITAYLWHTGLTDFQDALTIFTGKVIHYESENIGVRVYCQQRDSWIKRLPTDEVTRSKYVRAPEKSIGMAIPICYGDLRDAPARAPAAAYDAFRQGITSVAGMRRAGVRGVVTKAGKGGSGEKGQVLFAGHACKLFNDDANGSTPAIESGDRLSEIDPIGGDVLNAATGTGFNVADITSADVQPFDCFYPVLVLDSRQPAANPGENARAATDPFNETSYAKLDYDNSLRELRFKLPDVPPQGQAYVVKMVIGYLTSVGATHIKFQLSDGSTTAGDTTLTASTTRTAQGATAVGSAGTPIARGSALVDDGWGFGAIGTYLRIYFSGTGTGETAQIFYAGVVIQFRPNWPIISPARTESRFDFRNNYQGGDRPWVWATAARPQTVTIQQVEQVDSTFYATLEGIADDGGGTYTGSVSALIERPPDVIRHFLATYCGETDGTTVETGSNVNGSFVDARDALTTWRGSNMKLALTVDEFSDSSSILRDLAGSAYVWPFISRLTNKWKLGVWKKALTTNAPRKLSRWDLMETSGPKLITHRDDVLNDVSLAFGFDAWQRRMVHESFVGTARSSAGHAYRNLRDESCTVVLNESDRFEWSDTGGAHNVGLTPGSYTPIGLAQHIQGLERAVGGADVLALNWGFQIVAGYNNRLDVVTGVSEARLTLTAGTYTATGLVNHVQSVLDGTFPGEFTVSYARATRKFTITKAAATTTRKLAFATGTDVLIQCAGVIGFTFADVTLAAGGSATSDFEVEEELFSLVMDANWSMPFETGTYGIDASPARNCCALLGFDLARDRAAAPYQVPESPHNNREEQCATSATRYGKRPSQTIQLRAVNDTDTAREVRNRHLDLYLDPPVEIQFQTERAVDFDLCDVFEFTSDVDEVQPFVVPGTDGSWASKQFIVTGIVQHNTPTKHQEVTAFYVPGA